MSKTVLITGANGFLGSHVLRAIFQKTQYNAVILIHDPKNLWRIQDILNESRLRLYYTGNESIKRIFKENKINGVIHIATEYGRKERDIQKIVTANLLFPLAILETAIETESGFFINTDSYYNKGGRIYSPMEYYSISKNSLVVWLKNISGRLKIVNLYLEHVFGEDDSETKFTANLIQSVAIQKIEKMDMTPGEQKRDFIYAPDVADAFLKAMEYVSDNESGYESFSIGSGKSISIREFAEKIKLISNSRTDLHFGALDYRPGEIMDSFADVDSLEKLGWSPAHTVDEGIANIINHSNKKKGTI